MQRQREKLASRYSAPLLLLSGTTSSTLRPRQNQLHISSSNSHFVRRILDGHTVSVDACRKESRRGNTIVQSSIFCLQSSRFYTSTVRKTSSRHSASSSQEKNQPQEEQQATPRKSENEEVTSSTTTTSQPVEDTSATPTPTPSSSSPLSAFSDLLFGPSAATTSSTRNQEAKEEEEGATQTQQQQEEEQQKQEQQVQQQQQQEAQEQVQSEAAKRPSTLRYLYSVFAGNKEEALVFITCAAILLFTGLYWLPSSHRRTVRLINATEVEVNRTMSELNQELQGLKDRWERDMKSREELVRQVQEENSKLTSSIDRMTTVLKACAPSFQR